MGEKVFRTHDELLSILESRGICFHEKGSKGSAKKALQHIGYYNLINGYNKLFILSKDPEDTYKSGTTVDEMVALYNFDKELRSVLFENILFFETNVKTIIAYYFSRAYGHDNYLLFSNFDTKKKDSHKNITSLISEFQRQIASRSSDPAILHYLKEYGYIPLWVANNVLTFGQISKFYAVMKQQNRQEVSKVFHVQDSELESILHYLSSVRNICAHGNRLYCYKSTAPLVDLGAHTALLIPKTDKGEYLYGKRDLFAAIIALKYVIPTSNYNKMIKKINGILNKYRPRFSVISEKDILKEMGFPADWKSKLLKL